MKKIKVSSLAIFVLFCIGIGMMAESTPSNAFQGTNGRIVFLSKRDGIDWEIYTMNPDGSQVTRLTDNNVDEERPGFSPDGRKIVYSSEVTGGGDIYVMNADGSSKTRLTTGNALENGPQWSSDGTKILYKKEVNGQDDIWIMNADGSDQRSFVNNPTYNESSPVWASDNSGVAFAYKQIGSDVPVEVYTSNTSGGQLFRVTNNTHMDTAPAWSPNAQKLVFRSTRLVNGADQKNDLYVINRDGTGETHLVSHPAEDRGPAWSPDGTKIIFFSNRPDAQGNNDYDIWTVNSTNGANPINLTANSPADDWSPDWGTATGAPLPSPSPSTSPSSSPRPRPSASPRISPSPRPRQLPSPSSFPSPSPFDFDFNDDGVVNIADIKQLLQNMTKQFFTQYDTDGNNKSNSLDFSAIRSTVSVPLVSPSPSSSASPRSDPTVPPSGLKTKKWHPGHYFNVQIHSMDDPAEHLLMYRQAKFDNIRGIKVKAAWRQFEQNRGEYNYQLIDDMLNALKHPTDPSKDKQLFIQVMDRDFNDPCSTSRLLPGYIRSNYSESTPGLCYTKIWEPEAMDQLINLYRAIGNRFDNHPQFEGVGNQETAGPVFEGHQPELLTQLIRFHRQIADSYQKTHVLQYTNWLSVGGGACNGLEQLTEAILPLGHGLSNPDSVPWEGLPWNCVAGTYNYPGLEPEDKPKPMYEIYRRYKNRIPIAIGNDVSQLGDPTGGVNTRTFNGEKMDYDGLVKYIYQTFVSGYTYMNSYTVTSAGGNYIFWSNHFCNSSVECSTQKSANYVNAVLDLVNNSSKSTIQTCPSNILCLQ